MVFSVLRLIGPECEASPLRVPRRRCENEALPCFSQRGLSGGRPPRCRPYPSCSPRLTFFSKTAGVNVFLSTGRVPVGSWCDFQAEILSGRQGQSRPDSGASVSQSWQTAGNGGAWSSISVWTLLCTRDDRTPLGNLCALQR